MQTQNKMSTPAQPSISVRNFDFYYGDAKVLHGVSMDIPDRRVTALIGPSGCGKSTFMRSMNRMNDIIPDAHGEGTIEIDGHNIYEERYGRRGAAAARGDGVPEIESVSQVHLRQRCLRDEDRRHAKQA